MNARLQEVVDVLRSGKYKQGEHVLATEDGYYCCLGVMCEIYQEKVGDLSIGLSEQSWATGIRTYDGEAQYLPKKVQQYFGIRFRSGTFSKNDHLNSLTYCNDHGMSFVEIADLIEKYADDLVGDMSI